jgi:hypothetical protein
MVNRVLRASRRILVELIADELLHFFRRVQARPLQRLSMLQFVGTAGALDATDPFRLGEQRLVVRSEAKTSSIQVRRAGSLDVD